MKESLKLAHAPIVEAVIEIQCDLPPGTDVASLEERAKEKLGDSYPNVRRQITERREVRWAAEQRVETGVRKHVTALQFLSKDEKQIVQMRPEGYSFNRLAPYGSLDEYLPEIERTWNAFRELTSPVHVREIGLRYINRIVLPAPGGQLDLTEYLQINPHIPDESLTYVGFLIQHAAVEEETGNRANITLATEPPADESAPIIFDIEVLSGRMGPPEAWEELREAILSLRRLKNRLFERTLTEKCLNLFRQP